LLQRKKLLKKIVQNNLFLSEEKFVEIISVASKEKVTEKNCSKQFVSFGEKSC
jgi:hypothetical protein